jgi:hypothetical protein
MDKPFAHYLAEIQKAYVVLPKALRIRVERWIEKLATTGNNPVWKKQRNAYAKLLLSMVVSRHLEAPFNVLPPEGSLPPLDSQQKIASRNLLGSHETEFWRDLYHRFEDVSEPVYAADGFSYSEEKGDDVARAVHNRSGVKSQVAVCTASNSLALSKEIQSLNMLAREQSQKIRLLEQQLHDERVQHELQLQRLNYSHRVEVNNLKEQLENFATELSVDALSPSRRETRQFLQDPANSPTLAGAPLSPALSRLIGSLDGSGTPPRRPFSPPGKSTSPLRQPNSSARLGKHSFLSFLEQKNHITASLNKVTAFDTTAYDITPRSPQLPNGSYAQKAAPATAAREAEADAVVFGEANVDAQGAETSQFDSSALDASLRWGGNHNYRRSAEADAENEAFLAHIDRFQSEIKKINTNVTMTSPDRF